MLEAVLATASELRTDAYAVLLFVRLRRHAPLTTLGSCYVRAAFASSTVASGVMPRTRNRRSAEPSSATVAIATGGSHGQITNLSVRNFGRKQSLKARECSGVHTGKAEINFAEKASAARWQAQRSGLGFPDASDSLGNCEPLASCDGDRGDIARRSRVC